MPGLLSAAAVMEPPSFMMTDDGPPNATLNVTGGSPPYLRGLPDEDLVALARREIEASREARRNAGTDGPLKESQPGITIDLGHKNIYRLPEEVIDVIKDEIERLALSHNQVSVFPARLAECVRLRYLNVRYNALREFPQPILNLGSLEILDISKNRIRVLPDELSNLTSLKVLAIQRNKIEKLPLCLGDISSLSVLKLDGNPLTFPPHEICTIKEGAPNPTSENEKDAIITSQVKRYLRQISTRERLKVDSEGESSESTIETPRPPKRVGSGRFPVRPNIGALDGIDLSSTDSLPAQLQAAQTRPHIRVQSQHNSAVRKPKVAPLLLANERNRSHSETVAPAVPRSKRMGMVTQKSHGPGERNVDISTLDGSARRLSHSHSLSHESALSNTVAPNGAVVAGKLGDPRDPSHQRQLPAQRLSDLLEHKRRSRAPDISVEAAKGVRYLLNQIMDPVYNLIPFFKSMEMQKFPARFSVARSEVEALNRLLVQFDTLAEEDEDEAVDVSKSIRTSCRRCMDVFVGVAEGLFLGAGDIVQHSDPRLIRTFLVFVYGSLMELRNSCSILGITLTSSQTPPYTPHENHRSITPTQAQPQLSRRLNPPPPLTEPIYINSQYNSTTTTLISPPSINGSLNGYADPLTSLGSATPRSGESFANLGSLARTGTMQSMEEAEENRLFEEIHKKITRACLLGCDGLPACKNKFDELRSSVRVMHNGSSAYPIFDRLMELNNEAYNTARALETRLGTVHLNDAMAPYQPDFWRATTAYIRAWSELAADTMRVQKVFDMIPDDVRHVMRPIQKAVKEASMAIMHSPWSRLAGNSGVHSGPGAAIIPPTPIAGGSALSSAHSTLTSSQLAAAGVHPHHHPYPHHQPLPPQYHGFGTAHGPFAHIPSSSASSTSSASPPSAYQHQQQYHHQYQLQQHLQQQQQMAISIAAASNTSLPYGHSVPQTPMSAALGAAAQATVPSTPGGSGGGGGGGAGPPPSQQQQNQQQQQQPGQHGQQPHHQSQSSSRVMERADLYLKNTQRRV